MLQRLPLLLPLLSLLAVDVQANSALRTIGVDVCACFPPEITFQLDFGSGCPVVLGAPGGVAQTECRIVGSNDNVTDLVPVVITTINILELSETNELLNQVRLDRNLMNGTNVTFRSIISMPDNITELEDIPALLQMTATGQNADGETLFNDVVLVFDNDCNDFPVITVGDSLGWRQVVGTTFPANRLCPSSITAAPTDAPSTTPITTQSPSAVSPGGPVGTPTGAPTVPPGDPSTDAPVMMPIDMDMSFSMSMSMSFSMSFSMSMSMWTTTHMKSVFDFGADVLDDVLMNDLGSPLAGEDPKQAPIATPGLIVIDSDAVEAEAEAASVQSVAVSQATPALVLQASAYARTDSSSKSSKASKSESSSSKSSKGGEPIVTAPEMEFGRSGTSKSSKSRRLRSREFGDDGREDVQ